MNGGTPKRSWVQRVLHWFRGPTYAHIDNPVTRTRDRLGPMLAEAGANADAMRRKRQSHQ